MNATKTTKLIQAHTVEKIRANVAAGEMASWPVEYGSVIRKIGTGRATCRACAKKIAKGVESLSFPWDFSGCGSWTCVESQIHANECPA